MISFLNLKENYKKFVRDMPVQNGVSWLAFKKRQTAAVNELNSWE